MKCITFNAHKYYMHGAASIKLIAHRVIFVTATNFPRTQFRQKVEMCKISLPNVVA